MKNEEYLKLIASIELLKKELGVTCTCNDETCSKCLLENCKDDNCPIHTLKLKERRRSRN